MKCWRWSMMCRRGGGISKGKIMKFYMQDSRSNVGTSAMFWAQDHKGYTTDLSKAHVFTQEQAQSQHNFRETDIPWPVGFIDMRAYQAVDCQHLDTGIFSKLEGDEFYASIPHQWDGNNLFFVGSGSTTTNLSLADVLTRRQVDFLCMSGAYQIFKKEYVDSKARRVVSVDMMKSRTSIKAAGIILRKPRKPKYTPINCGHCGRFLSERQVYFDCPNCGGDNWP